MMRMGHNGLTWIVSGVMVRGRSIARLGEGFAGWSGARGIVLDGNRDEVAVLPCGDGRDSEGLLSEESGMVPCLRAVGLAEVGDHRGRQREAGCRGRVLDEPEEG